MAAKINMGGLTGYPWLQKGYSYGRNDSGPFQTLITEGLNADVDADAVNFLYAGWTYTVERKGSGISRMEAHAGWNPGAGGTTYSTEVLENIWELDPQETDKALLEADFPNGASLALTSNKTREALSKIINDEAGRWNPPIPGVQPGAFAGTSIVWLFDGGMGVADSSDVIHLPTADYAPAHSLYLLMRAGVSAFPVEASIIKHSQLVSNLYAVQASFSNVGRIISSSSMYSIEGTPTSLLFGVPSTPSPSQFIEAAGDLQYGWRKSRPAVTRLALFKWRIVQNWQLGLFPTKIFGIVI